LLHTGVENTATTLTAVMYFLVANLPCMARLRDEVAASFGSSDAITGDATASLPYLNAVLEETMRIFPPSPFGPPCVSPGEMVGGVYFPEGLYVSTDIISLHCDPWSAPEPHSFSRTDGLEKTGNQASRTFFRLASALVRVLELP
jgi:cytochrome P450